MSDPNTILDRFTDEALAYVEIEYDCHKLLMSPTKAAQLVELLASGQCAEIPYNRETLKITDKVPNVHIRMFTKERLNEMLFEENTLHQSD